MILYGRGGENPSQLRTRSEPVFLISRTPHLEWRRLRPKGQPPRIFPYRFETGNSSRISCSPILCSSVVTGIEDDLVRDDCRFFIPVPPTVPGDPPMPAYFFERDLSGRVPPAGHEKEYSIAHRGDPGGFKSGIGRSLWGTCSIQAERFRSLQHASTRPRNSSANGCIPDPAYSDTHR